MLNRRQLDFNAQVRNIVDTANYIDVTYAGSHSLNSEISNLVNDLIYSLSSIGLLNEKDLANLSSRFVPALRDKEIDSHNALKTLSEVRERLKKIKNELESVSTDAGTTRLKLKGKADSCIGRSINPLLVEISSYEHALHSIRKNIPKDVDIVLSDDISGLAEHRSSIYTSKDNVVSKSKITFRPKAIFETVPLQGLAIHEYVHSSQQLLHLKSLENTAKKEGFSTKEQKEKDYINSIILAESGSTSIEKLKMFEEKFGKLPDEYANLLSTVEKLASELKPPEDFSNIIFNWNEEFIKYRKRFTEMLAWEVENKVLSGKTYVPGMEKAINAFMSLLQKYLPENFQAIQNLVSDLKRSGLSESDKIDLQFEAMLEESYSVEELSEKLLQGDVKSKSMRFMEVAQRLPTPSGGGFDFTNDKLRNLLQNTFGRRLATRLNELNINLDEGEFMNLVSNIINREAAGKGLKTKGVGKHTVRIRKMIQESLQEVLSSVSATEILKGINIEAETQKILNEQKITKYEKLKAKNQLPPEEKAQKDAEEKARREEANAKRKAEAEARAEERRQKSLQTTKEREEIKLRAAEERAKLREQQRQETKARTESEKVEKETQQKQKIGDYTKRIERLVIDEKQKEFLTGKAGLKTLFGINRGELVKKTETSAAILRDLNPDISEKDLNAALKRAKQNLKVFFDTLDNRIEELKKEAEARGEPIPSIDSTGDPNDIRRQKDETAAKKLRDEQIAALEKDATRGLRELLGSDEKYQSVIDLFGKHGFSPEDIARGTKEQLPSGTTVLKARKYLQTTETLPSGEEVKVDTQYYREAEVVINSAGQAQFRTNKRLLDFTDAIRENIKEVFRWSIGVGLVYGTMYKLQEIVQIAIDNQTKLADITVALGDSQRDVNSIFQDAAKVAALTGESINGVLEAYTLAYRAAGAVSDEFKRTEVANKLLADSMILTKLSGLSSAESIDTLSGSLRQLQTSNESSEDALMRGTDLLDKWVAVTQSANVDMATLAMAFSITSESAENAGMSVEELNGVIASLSEKIGGLGGKETGNAVRAIIGGMYSDQAKQALSEFGIAVLDSSGKMRNFLEVTQEIYSLWEKGIISDDQLNKIGYALGGGVRRGQQYVAFLSDYSRIQEIVAAQANSTGKANEALAKKIDTVQTATTRLGNAFQSLAQAAGTSGGILEVMTTLLNIGSALVDTFSVLIKLLGDFTIPMATIAALKLIGGMKFNETMNGLSSAAFASASGGTLTGMKGLAGAVAGGLTSFVAPAAIGMALPVMNRIGKDENSPLGPLAPLAPILGGAIGGALGISGGPIGIAIGSAIGSTFLDVAINGIGGFKPEFEKMFVPSPESGTKGDSKLSKEEKERLAKLSETERDYLAKQEEFAEKVFSEYGGGNAKIGGYSAKINAWGYTALNDVFGIFGGQTPAGKEGLADLNPNQLALMEAIKTNPALKKEYESILEERPVTEETPIEETALSKQAEQLFKTNIDVYKQLSSSFSQTIEDQLLEGRITAKQYREAMSRVPNFGSLLSGWKTMFPQGSEITDNNLARFATVATQEELDTMNQLKTAVFQATEALERAEPFYEYEGVKYETPEAIKELITSLQGQGTQYVQSVNAQAAVAQYPLPGITPISGITEEGFDAAYTIALNRQRERADAMIKEEKLTEDVFQDMLKLEEDSGGKFYDLGLKVGILFRKGLLESNQEILQEVLNENLDSLKQFQVPTEDLGLNFFDMTSGEFNKALGGYDAMVSKLQSAAKAGGAEFKTEESWFLPVLEDGIGKPMRLDMRIVQYLLQQILDTEKKQLNGIYNLPTDSSFYVPWWEGFVNPRTGGGVGNFGVTDVGTTESSEMVSNQYKSMEAKIDRLDKIAANDLAQGTIKPETMNEDTFVGLFSQLLENSETLYPQSFANPAGSPQPQDAPKESFLDQVTAFLNALISGQRDGLFGRTKWKDAPMDEKLYQETGMNTAPRRAERQLVDTKVVSTKLALNFTSNIRLVVDGATLAMVVKKYLGDELATYSDNASSLSGVV